MLYLEISRLYYFNCHHVIIPHWSIYRGLAGPWESAGLSAGFFSWRPSSPSVTNQLVPQLGTDWYFS